MELNSFVIGKDKNNIRTPLWWLVHNIILARYQYKGYDNPKCYMESDSIERALIYSGMCAIFDNNGKIVALPAVTDNINIYGRASKVSAYSFGFDGAITLNDESIKFNNFTSGLEVGKNCAIIFNNAQCLSSMALVTPYINRLADIWKKMGNNLNISQFFGIIGGSGEAGEALEKKYTDCLEKGLMFMNVNDIETFKNKIQAFNFNAEYRQEDYHKDFDTTWIWLLNVLGINNVGVEKRERLLVDEISANNEILEIVKDTTFTYRETGIKQANKMFGLQLEIVKRGETENVQREESKQDKKDNNEDGGNDKQ